MVGHDPLCLKFSNRGHENTHSKEHLFKILKKGRREKNFSQWRFKIPKKSAEISTLRNKFPLKTFMTTVRKVNTPWITHHSPSWAALPFSLYIILLYISRPLSLIDLRLSQWHNFSVQNVQIHMCVELKVIIVIRSFHFSVQHQLTSGCLVRSECPPSHNIIVGNAKHSR